MKKNTVNIAEAARRQAQALTPEQKKEHFLRALSQKREAWATGIMFNLCHGRGALTEQEEQSIVESALRMADRMMTSLFPVKVSHPDPAEGSTEAKEE